MRGFCDVLTKPFPMEELSAMLQRVLGRGATG